MFWLWHVKLLFKERLNSAIRFSSSKKHSILKSKKMPPSIPDRWIPYKACGKVIEGTRFICFKVPLKRTVQTSNREIKEIWDINALLRAIPNLGAVIDLTNTYRYYNPQDLKTAGVLHRKILMPGRIIPPEEKVTEFMDACDEFLGKYCDFLVGVHCTHGLNRTGYMVCRYMRDRMGIDAKDAVKRFELARGYQIERENYIADLIGSKPQPAHFGNSTKLKPVADEEDLLDNPAENTGKSKKKYSYNGESCRDECRNREDGYSSSGRYVRAPPYSKNSNKSRPENGSNHDDHRGNSSTLNSRDERTSTDSNRSYDFRYDY